MIRTWHLASIALATLSLAAAPILPAGNTAQASHGGQIPCADPLGRGCPDLVVDPDTMNPSAPRTKNFKENSCVVQEGMIEAGTRTVIYFTFTTPNLGPGDLVVGNPEDHPEWFEFSACHGHFHFREYADYRLWTADGYADWNALRAADPGAGAAQVLAANPGLADEFVAGGKRGFCVVDIVPYSVAPPKYLVCDFQGISAGWADEYDSDLDGQFIDVTGVPPGSYFLEAEVNAEHFYEEVGYANNRAAVSVTI